MFYIFAFDFIFRNEIQSAIDALQIKDGLGEYNSHKSIPKTLIIIIKIINIMLLIIIR